MKKNYSTIKNLNSNIPYYFDPSFNLSNLKNLNFGGLRKDGYFKAPIKNKPLFSIITVCLNSELTLEKTILSVLEQTYDNVEFIIIDGQSKDNTIGIIKKYEKFIDFWLSEKDEGIFNAINKGIKVSSGNIIGVLNSDDTYTKSALSLADKYFKKKIDFLFGSVEKERLLSGFNKKKINWKFNIFPAHSSGFFITKDAQTKVGLYDEEFKLHADYDLIYKLICNLKLNGLATKKNEVTGVFNVKGRSSEEKKLDYYLEEFKIRNKNKQNFLYICCLVLVKITYHFLYQLKFFKLFSKYVKTKLDF